MAELGALPADEVESADAGRTSQSEVATRWNPGPRGALVLFAIAIVALVLTGVGWWRLQTSPRPVSAVTPLMSSSDVAAEVVVTVSGSVQRPGLIKLRPGSRVADAIDAAGGLVPGTQLGALNLARKVRDGELVMVGASAPASGGPSAGAAAQLINLNTATEAELTGLPGVGPVLAGRIIAYRTKHGAFGSVDDLRKVDGIGAARFSQLSELVTV